MSDRDLQEWLETPGDRRPSPPNFDFQVYWRQQEMLVELQGGGALSGRRYGIHFTAYGAKFEVNGGPVGHLSNPKPAGEWSLLELRDTLAMLIADYEDLQRVPNRESPSA